MKKEELQSKLMAKAWKDPEFKKRLLANPKETISAFIKEHFPNEKKLENSNFKIVEHDPKTIVIALPQAPSNAQELSENELEKLAAGWCMISQQDRLIGEENL